ncbi:uncharacterized protein LOC115310973, partial [Ixodes scapularis]|uniref:uncharacterized protein LOC115310973 n=1 Tax=Ixodes scapularis TaxID=6945 RepID=UPI001C39258E
KAIRTPECTSDGTSIRTLLNSYKANGHKELKDVKVKGRKCVVVDPNFTEVVLRVHWLPTYVTDREVNAAFAEFGVVKEITSEMWKSPTGDYEVETSTRAVRIILKKGGRRDELPHQGHVADYSVLISVPGRPPMCLRCYQLWHMRRQCKAPWCRGCRGHGQVEAVCVPTYASKTRHEPLRERRQELLDDGDMEWAAVGDVNEAHPTPYLQILREIVDASAAVPPADIRGKSPNEDDTDGSSSVGEPGPVSAEKVAAATSIPAPTLPTASREEAKEATPPAPTAAPGKAPLPEPNAGAPLKDTVKATRQSARKKTKDLLPDLPALRPVETDMSLLEKV